MALELQLNACETCEGIDIVDITGSYSLENPGGYGTPNSPPGPEWFDTYIVEVWAPGVDRNSTPTYTLNLLSSAPAPDDNGYYTWSVTAAAMGLSEILSGVWSFKTTATLGASTFIADADVPFITEIQGKVDAKMKYYDPTCPCRDGCEDPMKVYRIFTTLSCGRPCSGDKADRTITYLRYLLKNCC